MVEEPWWKKDQELSRARKAAAVARAACASPGDSFLIVTEGTVTEPVYFELLRESLQLSTVTVKVMPGQHSDPRHVIQSAADEVKALAHRVRKKKLAVTELEKFDHVWAVIDTDVATRQEFWNDVVQKARDLKVNLAHSTPCFEYWLLLHLRMTTRGDLIDGATTKSAFGTALGRNYSTNRETTEEAMKLLLPIWPTAVKHAQQVRKYHEDGGTPAPANPSTEVDRIVCALKDSLPASLRKIPCREA
jgi:hypothetical protein